MRRTLLSVTALFLLGAASGDETVERTVVFRDGSVLCLTFENAALTIRDVQDDGSISTTPVRLSEAGALVFSLRPQIETLGRVRAALQGLAADTWEDREAATRALEAEGPAIRGVLDAARAGAEDPEVEMRLAMLLARLPPGEEAPGEGVADTVTRADGTVREVDFGDWRLAARLRGIPVVLDRSLVRELRTAGPEAAAPPPVCGAATRFERIGQDLDGSFPPHVTRIDFDTAPDGTRIAAGAEVGRAYVPSGVTIETSVAGALVHADDYTVGGRSGGNSCATNAPRWEGVLTIRFHAPGRPEIPAGVTHTGLWIAAVSAGSTTLEAYDLRGAKIGEAVTVAGPNDFLAVRSSIPIGHLRVVPNVAVDPNYTIDDLVFDAPRPRDDASDADRFAVVLSSGERLLADACALSDGRLRAEGLRIGIDRCDFPPRDVRRVILPYANPRPLRLEEGTQARGSLELATGRTLAIGDGELRFESWDEEGLVLTGGDAPLRIPWTEIAAFAPAPAE